MRIAILQHAPHEGPGSIASWLDARGIPWVLYRRSTLPPRDSHDGLIILGGPQSVYDTESDPWLAAEIDYVRAALDSGQPVLGICLGSQLIAAALGARVARNPVKEMGWYEVTRVPAAADSAFSDLLPEKMTVLHWHLDGYELPAGATRLYSSELSREQGYSIGSQVIAFQFHTELTPDALPEWLAKEPPVPAQWTQSAAEILAGAEHCQAGERFLVPVLERLFG